MKAKRIYSIRFRIMWLFGAVFIPLVMGFIFYSSTVIENAQKAVYGIGRSGFDMHMAMLEKELEGIDIYLNDMILNNEEIRELSQCHNREETYRLAYRVRENFSAPLKVNQELLCMMVFSAVNNYYLAEYNDNYAINRIYTLQLSEQLESALIRKCLEEEHSNTWFRMELFGRQLYCRIKQYGEVYCIGVLDLEMVAGNIEKDYGNQGKIVFFENQELLTGSDFISENHLTIPSDTEEYKISGQDIKYMGIYSETEHFCAAWFMPVSISSAMLSSGEKIGIACTVFLIIAIPVSFWYLRKYILNPLGSLKLTMEHISEDTMVISEEIHYKTEEFEQINETFKRMLGRIRDLKIDSYEKELQRQRIEYQYLQLQIRPHFFFNCMKNMYGMAQSKDIEAMKQSILLLSAHLRYIFANNTDGIMLSREVQQCQNYAQLLKYSQKITCQMELEIEAGLADTPVPPISILTFVENSAKYALREGKILRIGIRVHSLVVEDKKYMQIEITDNGPGFSVEELKLLNEKKEIIDNNGCRHVGIYNVIHRCIFNYGNDFYISFINMDGAKIKMLIPLTRRENNEAADCG